MQESPHPPRSTLRAVVLLHTLPDASSHHDLLLERSPDSPHAASDPHDRRLIAFRVGPPPHDPRTTSAPAIRLHDHRVRYLDHQGPLTRNRGRVDRLASAELRSLRESPHRVDAILRFPRATCELRAERQAGDAWRLTLTWSQPD